MIIGDEFKNIVSEFLSKQKKELKKIYSLLCRIKWFPKNLFVFLTTPIICKKKIKNLNFFEQKFNSQNGEDGIIKIIFDKIKTTNKFCVEFGIHPTEGNTILLKKLGWKCLWMDGNGDNKDIKKEFITPKNIETIFKKYSVPKELDLLSIDIDSNDYWVWKAIKNYSPRVVIIEYNSNIPFNESKTIKYDPLASWDGTDYFGASLLALHKLGKTKGYTLVACDKRGINSFFIRNDSIEENFSIRELKEIYSPPRYGKIIRGKRRGYPKSKKEMISI